MSNITKHIKKQTNVKIKDLVEHCQDLEKYIKALEEKVKRKDEIIEKLTKGNRK